MTLPWITLLVTLAFMQAVRPRVKTEIAIDHQSVARSSVSQIEGALVFPGLQQEVEVLRDSWGIPHIYARNTRDLFMAQGFVAAQDRLWQMEIWRRTGEGKLAEIYGSSALARDRLARLLLYRGNMEAEWRSYSPDAREIIEAFVAGVNANIARRRENLPFEFKAMRITPEPWTPETCITRMTAYAMSRNLVNEVARAQLVRELGLQETLELWPLDPETRFDLPRGLDLSGIDPSILTDTTSTPRASTRNDGSNNWTVAGALTATGKPLLANDPHRAITIPSLRYMAHLVAPGWNVIGAGEPSIPGIAVGHNEWVAFGFTIVGIDQQDLYVEELNPANALEYRHKGKWLKMETRSETVRVKGRAQSESLDLHFTVHGPVIHEDRAKHRAYALRWVGTEPGAAGYMGSLSLDRATNWKEFLGALERWKVPSENLVYADVDGNIGWQAAGLAPVRKNWLGVLPVPGSGEYEWQGFLPLEQLPRLYNPSQGFIATANHNILPPGYRHSLGYEWAAPWRFRRIDEVLRSRKSFTIADFELLQHDETSLAARLLVPLLRETQPGTDRLRDSVQRLLAWNFVLDRVSAEAGIYQYWVARLIPLVWSKRLPAPRLALLGSRATQDLAIQWLRNPTAEVFGPDPVNTRNRCLLDALESALTELRAQYGPERKAWNWGNLHQAFFRHPLEGDPGLRTVLDRGPVPRGGDAITVNNTSAGANLRQTSGASYRQILDLSDWDRSVAINVPGQSGEPGSPHYDDLLPLWAEGKYHPLAFSRPYVEKVTRHRLILRPEPSSNR